MSKPAPVAVALDAPDLETAARWAGLVTPHVSTVKIGLELYLRYGPDVVATIRGASGVRVFLDLKLHDIPATVAGAARTVARLRPEVLTVHASGGPDVIRAATEAAPATKIAAVTLLTSLNEDQLGRIGVTGNVHDTVLRLAVLAVEAGAAGDCLLAARGQRGPGRGRARHHADHPGGAPGGLGGLRSGQGGDARGGRQSRVRPAGDRASHHWRAGSRCSRGCGGGVPAAAHPSLTVTPNISHREMSHSRGSA